MNKIKNLHKGDFLFFTSKKDYFPSNSMIFALSSAPLKSCTTTFPDLSSMKVAGIDSTLYCFAIGSSQPLRFETCVQINLSFAIASFHFTGSSSKETPIILRPFECSSL
nr:hypothetical protein [Flavobacterium marginilacus]